jgi:hypothetical protein
MTGFQVHPVADDYSLAERQPWLGALPVHRFVNRMAIAALSIRARQAIHHPIDELNARYLAGRSDCLHLRTIERLLTAIC